ncbi:MAG TPA: periplasmic heavy metal sensor [Pyrinomonadaceae bacterium]|nr:periplasmic heavy metal sensor [Pyrinomonadaceae bacterium]
MKRLGKIKTTAFAAIATLAVGAPVAIAQTAGQDGQQRPRAEGRGKGFGKGEGRGHRGGFGRRGDSGGFRGVELTADQKTRLQQIRQGFGERTRTLREQLRAKRQELRQAEQGTTFNEAFAAQKLTEAASIEARLMAERFRMRQESLSVLTPEQRQQIEQRRQGREQRRQQRRGARGGATTTAVQ